LKETGGGHSKNLGGTKSRNKIVPQKIPRKMDHTGQKKGGETLGAQEIAVGKRKAIYSLRIGEHQGRVKKKKP